MEDNHKYIYFDTYDHTGNTTTYGYTLPITPFTFVPVFDDGTKKKYSNIHIFWDFGDGTTSKSITATHYYKVPGWYNVTCYVLDELGIGYKSSFSQLLLVKDFITDSLVLSALNSKKESGKLQNPYTLYRFNSWQSYDAVKDEGYYINLNALSTTAPLFDSQKYNTDKWAHLKPSSRFIAEVYDSINKKNVYQIVDRIQTDSKEIYVNYNKTLSSIVICNPIDTGACFAGTSGKKLFYFVDDIPIQKEDSTEVVASTISLTFDTTKFKDFDNLNKTYEIPKYNILNTIQNSNVFSKVIEQLTPYRLTITSNGIDDDGLNNSINTFDIYGQKFVNQKIPFVVRFKDSNNFASKYNKIPQLIDVREDIQEAGYGFIQIKLLDQNNNEVNYDYYNVNSNLGVLSGEKFGGYFKGYVTVNKPLSNIRLYAESSPIVKERYIMDSSMAIIPEPASQKLHKITFQSDAIDPNIKTLDDSIVNVDGLSGIYTLCVTSDFNQGSPIQKLWVADSDSDLIVKYDIKNSSTSLNLPEATINLKDYFKASNLSPSNICSDVKNNVWVTLYDSISTIKISDTTNTITQIINPRCVIDNTINTNMLSNIQPGAIETDRYNNLYISYTNSLCSFVEKYNYDQVNENHFYNKKFDAPSGHFFTEIVSDGYGNVWGILKDNFSLSETLSSRLDKIFRFDKNGNNFITIPVSGSAWNITLDTKSNIWVTMNINQILSIDNVSLSTSYFYTPSTSIKSEYNYVSDLMGIAGSTDGNVYVIDDYSRKFHYFKANTNNISISSSSFDEVLFDASRIQDLFNGYGDWNGFKHIFKFQHIFPAENPLSGISSTFSTYDTTVPKYEIRKLNENFDMASQIKSYIHQEYLLESNVLFDDFISTIVGTISSDPNVLGKRLYEKISNFTTNNSDIDTCNIDALKSMYEMMNEDFYDFNGKVNSVPANLKRLMDIFSIKFSKLRGSRNKEACNFDKKGFFGDTQLLYGVNLGNKLDFFTSYISAGVPIVAFEKFSETYKLINTDIIGPLSSYYIQSKNTPYPLSGYSDQWGWGLVLPDNYITNAIPNYYIFYSYVSGYNNDQTEGIINWQDNYNTVPESINSLSAWRDIQSDLISYTLTKGLSLIK